MGSCVFSVLCMWLWHLSEVLVGNGCVHDGFCLSSPLMLSLFLSLVVVGSVCGCCGRVIICIQYFCLRLLWAVFFDVAVVGSVF